MEFVVQFIIEILSSESQHLAYLGECKTGLVAVSRGTR